METHISPEEHNALARKLEMHHAIFERIWTVSRIRFTKKVPTAGVLFNKKGECIDFFINREFWEKQSLTQKCFIISHECLHIALNHGIRGIQFRRNRGKFTIANYAQDLVINHNLVNKYGFDRDEIDPPTAKAPKGCYCWVDKFFEEHENVSDDENFEYYYNKILKKAKEELEELEKNNDLVDDHNFNQGESEEGDESEKGEKSNETGQGSDSKGEPEENSGNPDDLDPEDFDYFDSEEYTNDFSDVIDDLNKELSEEEKDTLKNFLEGNEEEKEFPTENPDYGPTGVTGGNMGGNKEEGEEEGEKKGQQAGTEAGTGWTFAKKLKREKKHKFEYIITNWAKKRMVPEYLEVDQWIFRNRRLGMLDTGLILPSEYETLERVKKEDKIEVWFFQDTSQSCAGYTDRFFSIADAMPLDKFNLRMFCFDTKTYETNLVDRKLYGFGGTYFHILENLIQDEITKDPKFSYPDAIFVVTDGWGSDIVPAKPKNWHWILTPGASKANIPEECVFHDLEDYE